MSEGKKAEVGSGLGGWPIKMRVCRINIIKNYWSMVYGLFIREASFVM